MFLLLPLDKRDRRSPFDMLTAVYNLFIIMNIAV